MLRSVALFSGLYDVVVGAFLLCASGTLTSVFGIPQAQPRIFSDLNALFLLAVGLGYYLPWRDPQTYRGYMWVMGVLLKAGGAAAFILEYAQRASSASFLLFAASDAAVAGLTLFALLSPRASAT